MLMKSVLGALSGVRAPRLTTLIFHRVQPHEVARFEQILSWVGETFNVLRPDEAVELLRENRLPPRALIITFDDGYADNVEIAMPILQRHGMAAVFFIASDFLDGGVMWNDRISFALRAAPVGTLSLAACDIGIDSVDLTDAARRSAAFEKVIAATKYLPPVRRQAVVDTLVELSGVTLPRDLMMTTAQLMALPAGGMVIGGHTCSHPILSSLDDAEAEREIIANKARLEAILDTRLTLFAYPNGGPGKDYDARHTRMVERAGYRAAFSTGWGASKHGDDVYQLARFLPWDTSRQRFLLRLAGNLLRPVTVV